MRITWLSRSAAATALCALVLTTAACGDDGTQDTEAAAGSNAALCDAVRSADDRMADLFAQSEQGGEAAKQAADELVTIADTLLAAAPRDLKPDYAVVRSAFTGFRAELEAVDFDVSRLPNGAAVTWSNPAFTESTGRLDPYTVKNCDGASLGD